MSSIKFGKNKKTGMLILMIIVILNLISINHGISAQKIELTPHYYDQFNPNAMMKDSVEVFYIKEALNIKSPVYLSRCRYYLPLAETIEAMGGKVQYYNPVWEISINEDLIVLTHLSFSKNGKSRALLNKMLVINRTHYISLLDLAEVFSLKTEWDIENKRISLFINKETIVPQARNKTGKTAFIRLEDIAASEKAHGKPEELGKLRIIADYLYSKNVPFHVAWVPRYIDPKLQIDNDPSITYNMYNADFIFTLDYFRARGGLIGLHGYTHQHDDLTSLVGNEFNKDSNNTEQLTRNRVELAIRSAERLQIPAGFFVLPHYSATPEQLKIIELYFHYIYQKKSYEYRNNIYSSKDKDWVVHYIPTPLDYLKSRYVTDDMIKSIEALEDTSIGSLFFHPHIEFDYINIKKDSNGYPHYTYSQTSSLHRIINALEDKGYKFKRIYDFH